MVRRYEEPVEVRVATVHPNPVVPAGRTGGSADTGNSVDAAGQDGAQRVPDAFVWRGRLYVVREILGHWRERRAWWRTALDGGEEPSLPQREIPQTQVPRSVRQDLEQHVWRVEASPGRMHGTGVYDLACEHPAPSASGDSASGDSASSRADSWRLVRIAD